MKNLPERIYLQIGDVCSDDIDFNSLDDVTWSSFQINDNDIVFELVNKGDKYVN